MNTMPLAKLYSQLTPRERLPLIIAAGARGDEVEQKRLRASAPKEKLELPDYFGLARGLAEAGNYHLLTLLDLAAQFWQCWGLWISCGLRDQRPTGANKSQRKKATAQNTKERHTGGIVRYYASRIVAHVEGWKRAANRSGGPAQVYDRLGDDSTNATACAPWCAAQPWKMRRTRPAWASARPIGAWPTRSSRRN